MPTTLAAKRYAKALFQLSVEQGLLDTVHGELHQVLELQQNSKEYADLASHRVITVEGRKKNIRLALEGRVNPLVLRFLLFLAEKHRHDIFADIVGEFDGLFNEAKGILDIRVISAHPLGADQLAEIERRMETRFHKKVRPAVKVDPGLIGGFQVRVGDIVYDYSISHLLESLHRKLITA